MGCGAQKGYAAAETSQPDAAAETSQPKAASETSQPEAALPSTPADAGPPTAGKTEQPDLIRDFSVVSDGPDAPKTPKQLEAGGQTPQAAAATAESGGARAATGEVVAEAQGEAQAPSSKEHSETVPPNSSPQEEAPVAAVETLDSQPSAAFSQPSVEAGAGDPDVMVGSSQPLLVSNISQATIAEPSQASCHGAPQPRTPASPGGSAAPAERAGAPAVFLPLLALDEDAPTYEPVQQGPATVVERVDDVPVVTTGWSTPSNLAQDVSLEGHDVLSHSIRDAVNQPLLVENFSESIEQPSDASLIS